jgi:hypothetical protein
MYNRPMWPQCWDLQGPRGLETKRPKEPEKGDLRGLKSHPTKNSAVVGYSSDSNDVNTKAEESPLL